MAPLERSLVVDFESYMIFKNMCISNCGKSGEIDIKDSPSLPRKEVWVRL